MPCDDGVHPGGDRLLGLRDGADLDEELDPDELAERRSQGRVHFAIVPSPARMERAGALSDSSTTIT
jgi:hypothetical protein